MCFSATASFAASGVLGGLGVIAYKQVRHKSQYLFALVPLLFAVQQAAEGFVWLSFTHAAFEPWQTSAMYVFLLFALIIWPVWIPLSAFYMDGVNRSKLIDIALGVGVIVSLYLAAGLVCHEIAVTMFDCHIRYFLPLATSNVYISSILYVFATIMPMLCSHVRYMRFFGVLCALSYVISYVYYYCVLVSVWCFFAAVLSSCVVFILYDQNRNAQLER